MSFHAGRVLVNTTYGGAAEVTGRQIAPIRPAMQSTPTEILNQIADAVAQAAARGRLPQVK